MKVWLLASALTLLFEGFLLAFAPDKWKAIMQDFIKMPTSQLRRMGWALLSGALILWILSLFA